MRPNVAVLRSALGPMLTETGILKRAVGSYVYDPVSGYETRDYVTVYEGPVLVHPEGDATMVPVGGTSWPVRPLEVTLPAETNVNINDVLTLTTCPNDPTLVGQEIEILDVRRDSWQIARFCTGRLAGTA